jgi:hypothetical protein
VKSLVLEAAVKGADDPRILLGCYVVAMKDGWEDASTFQWLQKAASLSPPDGPVQRVSLQDVVERHPVWREHQNRASAQLASGEIPLAVFGRATNRSLSEVCLLTFLSNSTVSDPRRRTPVYAYSGRREAFAGKEINTVVLDPTAILNAGVLGLLGKILERFKSVVLPHWTLGWLFDESEQMKVHQPSRYADAHELKRLIDGGVVLEFAETAVVDIELASEIGIELAELFAEAEADFGDGRGRRVLRSGPMHRMGSLLQEEAELGTHAGVVCGCVDVVDVLVRHGALTASEEQRARSFLAIHETSSVAVNVSDGSVLYADSIALGRLQHLGLLEKIYAAGLSVVISKHVAAEAKRRIQYQVLAGRASEVIEQIRETLSAGVQSGKVTVAARRNVDDAVYDNDRLPLVELELYRLADAAIVDDRFVNQFAHIDHPGGARTPIWTTHDLLNALALESEELFDCLARMRRGALAFVPIEQSELHALLAKTKVASGRVIEGGELKAIRENQYLYRMSEGLRTPQDDAWLNRMAHAIIGALKAQWQEDVPTSMAAARSEWLLARLDMYGWPHVEASADDRSSSTRHIRAQVLALMFAGDIPEATRQSYWTWLEKAVLSGLWERSGDGLYDAIVQDVTTIVRQWSGLARDGVQNGD